MKISPVSSERLDGGTAGVLRGRGPSDSHRLTNGAFFEGIATKGALTQRRLTKSFLWFFSSVLLCRFAPAVLILLNHTSFLSFQVCLFACQKSDSDKTMEK